MASFDHLWNRNGNGKLHDNGVGPHHGPRLAAPPLPQMASTFFDPAASRKVMSTDLFHTLHRAADYAKAANGRRTTLVLLSDMLQSTGQVNMERSGGIPGDAWITGLESEGRLPDLRNVCVLVVGADATTRSGARARQFWSHYFEAAGATYRPGNYRNMVSDPGEIGCA
ncbi:MAG: hypothetical protein JWL60_511 [Gemmatimonadetes bacterium]|nr:hypothetical protein [Gemmatimonadota bacterium]